VYGTAGPMPLEHKCHWSNAIGGINFNDSCFSGKTGVIEIYATRCLDFSSKCTKNAFGGRAPRTHWGSLQRSPRPPSWIGGVLLLREGREGERRGEEEKGRDMTEAAIRYGPLEE